MGDKEILGILQKNITKIRREFEVTTLCVFGSVARGEKGPESDVDIFVEMPPKIFMM